MSCSYCSVKRATALCGHCKSVGYCSVICADLHWNTHISGTVVDDTLPPLRIPKEHMLIKFMHRGGPSIYGLHTMRNLVENDPISLAMLNKLVTEYIDSTGRRAMQTTIDLLEELSDNQVLPNVYYTDSGYSFTEMFLFMQLSPQLFEELSVLTEEIDAIIKEDMSQLRIQTIRFFKRAILSDEYIMEEDGRASWEIGMILIPYDVETKTQRVDTYDARKPYVEFCQAIRYNILKDYNQQINLDTFAPNDVLPKGTLMYRGYRGKRGPVNKTLDYAWFGFDVIVPLVYMVPADDHDYKGLQDYLTKIGGIGVFETTEDIKLLNLSNVHNVSELKQAISTKAPAKVIEAFAKGWIIEKDTLNRQSHETYDVIVVNWLCDAGYGGYIAANVKGLHDEIFLCDVHNKTVHLGNYTPKDHMNFPAAHLPYSKYNLGLHWN